MDSGLRTWIAVCRLLEKATRGLVNLSDMFRIELMVMYQLSYWNWRHLHD